MNHISQQSNVYRPSSLAWVREQRDIDLTAKFVLTVLAAYHVDETGFGRPTLAAVGRDIERSIHTVRRAFKSLEARKLIVRAFTTSSPVPDLQLQLDSIPSSEQSR